MPRFAKIRWKDKDTKELQRLVKNFNQKVRYVQRNKPDIADIQPEKVNFNEIKASITTRSELNQALNSLKRYSKRGAEERQTIVTGDTPYETTRYEVREYKEKTRIRNIQKAYESKRHEFTPEKGVFTQRENLGLIKRSTQLPKSEEDFKRAMIALEKGLSRANYLEGLEDYKQNYLKAIKQLVPGDQSKVLKKIESLDSQTLFDLTVADDKLVIEFFYDDEFTPQTRGEEILNRWDEAINELNE